MIYKEGFMSKIIEIAKKYKENLEEYNKSTIRVNEIEMYHSLSEQNVDGYMKDIEESLQKDIKDKKSFPIFEKVINKMKGLK